MGFSGNQTGAATYTSSLVCDFSYPKLFILEISEFNSSNSIIKHAGSRFQYPNFVIHNDSNFSNVLHYRRKKKENTLTFDPAIVLSQLSIKLLDENHTTLNSNGINWNMEVGVEPNNK